MKGVFNFSQDINIVHKNEKQMKIYFGHPINMYGTAEESKLIQIIQNNFPEYSIENPNQKCHEEGYQRYKKEGKKGIDYYFIEVLPKMDAGIFLAFEDGMFGTGVYGEAKWLHENNKPIHEITLNGAIKDLVLVESRKLSVAETKARVYP